MQISQPEIGWKILHYDVVASTNDVIRMLSENEDIVHGTVVMADYQSSGRGQSGKGWESEPGKNIILSFCLVPMNIMAGEQPNLNLFICLAVYDLVNSCFPGITKIKWPNDIYVNDQKISGILIENVIQGQLIKSCVIGIGVNVNQKSFLVGRATSFRLLAGKEFDTKKLASELFFYLNNRYHEFNMKLRTKLNDDYLNALFLFGEKAKFQWGEEIIEGEIHGIDENGKLKLKTTEGMKFFSYREITFI
ncbi:MAG: biotin--[acetyl-CoA-carboxylase] ligase [Bacteroidia bacterium]